ncbi:hypothetical protein V1294_004892 [Bradyrhizobium sp. AZCC 1678]
MILPALVTFPTAEKPELTPRSPVMVPPALFVTVALTKANTPMFALPVIVPELRTVTLPLFEPTPDTVVPVMVAPVLLVTVTSS